LSQSHYVGHPLRTKNPGALKEVSPRIANDIESNFEIQSEYSVDHDMLQQMQQMGPDGDDFIPKQPIIAHIEKIKQKNKEKIDKYKQFALELRKKYKQAEQDSQQHYQDFIKKKQAQTDDMLSKKEDMYFHLKLANE
jgi:hypothetical protein